MKGKERENTSSLCRSRAMAWNFKFTMMQNVLSAIIFSAIKRFNYQITRPFDERSNDDGPPFITCIIPFPVMWLISVNYQAPFLRQWPNLNTNLSTHFLATLRTEILPVTQRDSFDETDAEQCGFNLQFSHCPFLLISCYISTLKKRLFMSFSHHRLAALFSGTFPFIYYSTQGPDRVGIGGSRSGRNIKPSLIHILKEIKQMVSYKLIQTRATCFFGWKVHSAEND